MLNKRLVISGRQLTNKDDVAQHLLQWANHRVGSGSVHYQLPCTSLTGSFSDGRIFLALLNDANPVRCEYKPSPSSAVNKQLAFQSAQVGSIFKKSWCVRAPVQLPRAHHNAHNLRRPQRIYGIPPMMDARDAESSSDGEIVAAYLALLYVSLPRYARRHRTPELPATRLHSPLI
jgi:hypothetical protein